MGCAGSCTRSSRGGHSLAELIAPGWDSLGFTHLLILWMLLEIPAQSCTSASLGRVNDANTRLNRFLLQFPLPTPDQLFSCHRSCTIITWEPQVTPQPLISPLAAHGQQRLWQAAFPPLGLRNNGKLLGRCCDLQ